MLVLVRPEQILLSVEPGGDRPCGRVISTEFYGHDAVVRVLADLDGPKTLIVRTSQAAALPAEGSLVAISVRGSVVAWVDAARPGEAADAVGTEASLDR